jgi:hypothetical protein
MSWKMHCHAWRHMLGRGKPVVLIRAAGRDALIEVMVLGSRAADALVWLLRMNLCGCRAGIQVFGYPFCGQIRAPFEVTVSDCLQQL